MKKIYTFVFGLLFIGVAFAAADNIPTSKNYVDNALAQKQDTITANDGAVQVLTNTGTAGEYGTQGIYDAAGEYAPQAQNLVDAITMNTGVQNAIDSEFQCIEWDENNECLLFNLGGIIQVPAGYTQLEYLESTGTQWIDTGIAYNNNTGIYIDFQYTNINTNEQILFGSLNPNFAFWRSSTRFLYGYKQGTGTTASFVVNDSELGTRHILELNFNNNVLAKLDNTVNQLPQSNFSSSRTLYLFAAHHNNIAYHPAKARIFAVKFTNNQILTRNFIPARRDSDGVLGMYDTVTNTFFTNSGTGEFIGGPVINLYLPAGN